MLKAIWKKLLYVVIMIFFYLIITTCNQNPFYGGGEDVDTEAPRISVTSPSSGAFIKNEFLLTGTCKDNTRISKVVISLVDQDKSWKANVDRSNNTWSYNFTAEDGLTAGENIFQIFAYDLQNNRSFSQVYTIIDTSDPVINIISPDRKANATDFDVLDVNEFDHIKYFVNNTLEIKGEIDDDSPIESVTIELIDETNTVDYTDTLSRETKSSTTAEGNTKNWTFIIDTVNIPTITDNTKYLIRVTAVDYAGNNLVETKDYIFIKQESDIPKVKITTPEAGTTIFPASIASGTAFDDDGLKSLYWFVGRTDVDHTSDGILMTDHTTWDVTTDEVKAGGVIDFSAQQPLITSWDITTPNGVGEYKLHLIPVDINNNYPSTPTEISFSQQTSEAPVASIIGPDPKQTYSGDVTIDISANGGGTEKNVTMISYKIESDLTADAAFTDITSFTHANTVNYSFSFDSALYSDATKHDITVTVKCTNEDGIDSFDAITYLRVDNDVPTITVDAPIAGSTINGDKQISGTWSDDYAGVKAIYIGYFTGMTDTIMNTTYNTNEALNLATDPDTPTLNKWIKLTDPAAAWNYIFETNVITNTQQNPFILYVAAVDAVGNLSYTKHSLIIDQESDKPTTEIFSPNPAGSDILLPGSTATGECEDDDGLSMIYWTVRKTSMGDPGSHLTWGTNISSDSASGVFDLSATTPTANSWQIETPAGIGDYTIYIVPVDENGLAASTYTSAEFVQKITDIPIIEILSPNPQNTQNGLVTVDVSADGGSIDNVISISYRIMSEGIADSGWIEKTSPTDFTAANNISYSFDFDITTYVSDTTHDVNLQVKCGNEVGKTSNTVIMNLKADNTAPELVISSPAVNDGVNGEWPIYGTASDDWSGIKDIYFGYFIDDSTVDTHDTEAELIAYTTGSPTQNRWHKLSTLAAAWEYGYNTEIITATSVNPYVIHIASVDNAGNVSMVDRTVDINQAYDIPTAEIIVPGEGATTYPTSIATGNCVDDDGIKEIYWYIRKTTLPALSTDYLTWTLDVSTDSEKSGKIDLTGENTPKVWSWQLTSPGGVGDFTIYIRPVDLDGDASDDSTTVTYRQDISDSPVINITAPLAQNTYSGDVTIDIDASCSAEKTITDIYYSLKSDLTGDINNWIPITGFTASSHVIHDLTFDTTPYISDTVHDIKLSVKCTDSTAADSFVISTNVKVDNVVPGIAITSPAADSEMNGEWPIAGTWSDDWSGIKDIYIGYFVDDSTVDTHTTEELLSTYSADPPEQNRWFKVSSPNAAWDLSFDTEVITSTFINPYTLYVAAVDNVGNTSMTSRQFDINQDYDKPSAQIFTPQASNSILPGSLASFSAEDDDGLGMVYWFIGDITVNYGAGLGNPPDPYTSWPIYNASDRTGDSIDLSVDSYPKAGSWQITTPNGVGNFRLYVMTVDRYGKEASSYTSVTYLQKETDVPTLSITGPSTQNTYNGDVTIDVSASGGSIDDVDHMFYKLSSALLTDPGWTETSGFPVQNSTSHSFGVNLDAYVDASVHDVQVEVYCTNDVGKSSAVASINLKADDTSPGISITSPGLNAGINGDWPVVGTWSDDWSGVKDIYIGYFLDDSTVDTHDTEAELLAHAANPPEVNRWYRYTNPPAAWTYTYDTEVITLTRENPFQIYVAAVDNVGNVSMTDQTVDINQDLDKPTGTIIVPGSGAVTFPSSTASGNVEDDDGLKRVHWLIRKTSVTYPGDPSTDTGWGDATGDNLESGTIEISGSPTIYSWQTTTPGGTGEYMIHIRPVDINDVMAAADITQTYNQEVSSAPEMYITGPDPAQTYNGVITVSVQGVGAGKNVTEIWYDLSSDLNPSAGWTQLTSSGGDFTASTTVNHDVTFDSTAYVDDTIHDIKFKVYCVNSEATSSSTVTTYLRADNTLPTVTISSPSGETIINGTEQQISGTVNDWSIVDALYISYYETTVTSNFPTKADLDTNSTTVLEPATYEKWFKISSPSTSWQHNYDTTIVSTGFGNDTITNFQLYVAAVDKVGNIKFTSQNYHINQDQDKPLVSISQPSYSGSDTEPWTTVNDMEKFGSTFLITGSSSDDDGVQTVKIDVKLMNYTGGGHSVTSTYVENQEVIGTTYWSYTVEDLTVCTEGSQYYIITPYVTDINGRQETGTSHYFIVSNESPEIEIMWPAVVDPDGDEREYEGEGIQTISDVFGTTISNVEDDIYWDNNNKNNHMYLSDSTKFFFGWENQTANPDSPNTNGYPDINDDGTTAASTYSVDFNESTLGIFDTEADDSGKSGYYRMIFRAKDGNVDGNITRVEISYDGGASWEDAFYNAGAPITSTDTSYPTKYALETTHGDGYTWFYANIDTSAAEMEGSHIIKVKVTDDNNPIPYFSISTIQITTDNNAPTGEILYWGSDGDNTNLDTSNGYIGGTALDLDSGIRYAKIYIWDNQGDAEQANYGDGTTDTGDPSLAADIDGTTYYVDIADLEDIDTAADTAPDYMIKADMINSLQWNITDVYSGRNFVDGKKLVALQVIDNASNTSYSFEELEFSEYPAILDTTSFSWNSQTEPEQVARLWIGGNLTMSGSTHDSKVGDLAPGITKINIHIKNDSGLGTLETWSTDTGEITVSGASTTLPYSGTGTLDWDLSAQDTDNIPGVPDDGNYLMEIEVVDLKGVTTTTEQYIFIDNNAPDLVVLDPTADLAVTGDFNINGTISDTGGLGTECITITIYDSATPKDTWTIGQSGGVWNQWWNTANTDAFTKVTVTATDKAFNSISQDVTITRDLNAPHFKTGTFSLTDTDGVATLLDDFTTFTDIYSEIDTDVYLVRGDLTFATTIEDNEPITGSRLYVSGMLQDGSDTTTDEPEQTPVPETAPDSPYEIGQSSTYAYNGMSNGEYTYRVWIEQQSGAIEVNLRKHFIVDNEKPHIWLEDMLATDYVTNTDPIGHIETGSTYDGADDDVSGTILLNIKVFDNYLIDTVYLKAPGFSDFTDWAMILDRNNSTGALTTFDSGTSVGALDYWECELDAAETIKENKNWISLTFKINTADVTNVAALTQSLQFKAIDMAGNEVDTASNSVETGTDPITEADVLNDAIKLITADANYQKMAQKDVDIVPYITEVSRTMTTERTKYGKIVVQQDESITIKGYNLGQTGTNWIHIDNTTDPTDNTGYDDVTGTTNGTYTEMSATVPTAAHSGWLRVRVNDVEAINNINDNAQATNKEQGTDADGDNWNDDRYLQVWATGDSFNQSNDPKYPSMSMETDGTLWGCWSNYSGSYSFYATTSSRTTIHSSYDPPEWTDIVVDPDGDRYTVLLENHIGNTGSTDWGELTVEFNNSNWTKIEELGNDANKMTIDHSDGEDEQLFQFQNARVTSYNNRAYISYYDDWGKCLKYAVIQENGTVIRRADGLSNHENQVAVVDGTDDLDDTPTDGPDVGLWSDIQIDTIGGTKIVIAYYDTTNRKLKLARGTVETPTGASEWNHFDVTSTDSFIGQYVSMKIDSSGNLHMAAFNNAEGDLVYIKATKSGESYTFSTPVTIDSAGAVGQWVDVTLFNDIPHISYLNTSMSSTFYGLKYAYFDTDLNDWEYGVVAAGSSVDITRTSIEVHSSASWGFAAIGYGSDNFDLVYLQPEL